VFHLVKKAFDTVALTITGVIVREFAGAGWDRGYHRLHSVVTQALRNAVGIIAFVHRGRFEHIVGIQALIERFKLTAVVSMPSREMESNAAVFVDGRRVDFRAQSSTRAPQSLVAAVFLVLLPRAGGLVPLWSPSTDDELGRSIRTEGTAKAAAILPALPSVEIACKLHASSPTPVVNPAKGSPHDSNTRQLPENRDHSVRQGLPHANAWPLLTLL